MSRPNLKRLTSQPTGFCGAQLDDQNLRTVRELAFLLWRIMPVDPRATCRECRGDGGQHTSLCRIGAAQAFFQAHDELLGLAQMEGAVAETPSGKAWKTAIWEPLEAEAGQSGAPVAVPL